MLFPWMRAVAVLMLLPIISKISLDSDKANAGGVEAGQRRKAHPSNPRGLDARAQGKETGALDFCALDSS